MKTKKLKIKAVISLSRRAVCTKPISPSWKNLWLPADISDKEVFVASAIGLSALGDTGSEAIGKLTDALHKAFPDQELVIT